MNFEKVLRKSPSGENCDASHKILGTIPSQKVTKEFRGTKCLRLTMKPVSMWTEFESSLKLPVLCPLTFLLKKFSYLDIKWNLIIGSNMKLYLVVSRV